MTDRIDLVYDRLLADEKLKTGTKYERLAAIAFRILTERTTLHDLRLRGEVGVAHQIDAVVGDEHKRILVEAKDYDRRVDLPVVRDFSAVVEDLQPDEAFVVTAIGYSDNAKRWAEAKRLTLALLRPPEEEDWGNLVKRIDLTMTMSAPSDPKVQWSIDPSEAGRFEGDRNPIGHHLLDEVMIGGSSGQPSPFRDLIEPQIEAEYPSAPLGQPADIGGAHNFDEQTWLYLPDEEPIRVKGYTWTVNIAVATHEFSLGFGIGGLAAELVLRTLDGSIHRSSPIVRSGPGPSMAIPLCRVRRPRSRRFAVARINRFVYSRGRAVPSVSRFVSSP